MMTFRLEDPTCSVDGCRSRVRSVDGHSCPDAGKVRDVHIARWPKAGTIEGNAADLAVVTVLVAGGIGDFGAYRAIVDMGDLSDTIADVVARRGEKLTKAEAEDVFRFFFRFFPDRYRR